MKVLLPKFYKKSYKEIANKIAHAYSTLWWEFWIGKDHCELCHKVNTNLQAIESLWVCSVCTQLNYSEHAQCACIFKVTWLFSKMYVDHLLHQKLRTDSSHQDCHTQQCCWHFEACFRDRWPARQRAWRWEMGFRTCSHQSCERWKAVCHSLPPNHPSWSGCNEVDPQACRRIERRALWKMDGSRALATNLQS